MHIRPRDRDKVDDLFKGNAKMMAIEIDAVQEEYIAYIVTKKGVHNAWLSTLYNIDVV